MRAEQLSLLTRNRADQYAGIITTLITVFMLHALYPTWILAVWAGLSCLVILRRAHLARSCNASLLTPQSVRVWSRAITACATASGLLWGITGATILLYPTPNVIFFIIFMTGGMTGISATSDAAHRPAMLGFALAAEIPVIAALLVHPAAGHAVFAAMLFFFILLLLNAALKFNRAIAATIRMRFAQEKLLAQVQSSQTAMADAHQLAKIGSWSLDQKSQIISLSTEAYRIFGIDPANPAPAFSLITSRIHADDQAMVRACVTASLTAPETISLDHRLIMDDYTIRFLRVRAKTVFDESGQPIRITGSVQDVTGRQMIEKRLEFANLVLNHQLAEQQLAEDRVQFANILLNTQMEASPDGIQVANAEREMISFNQHFAEIWRVPPAEMKTGNDLFLRPHMLAQVQSPESYAERLQYIINHPDEAGQDDILLADGRTLERHTRPLRTADGRDLGRVWFFRDITARQAAAQKLEFTNILLNTQMEASRDGILAADGNGNIIAVNRRYGEINQIRVDDLPGAHLSIAVSRVAGSMKDPAAFLRDPALPDIDAEHEMADGRIISRFITRLRTANGEHLGGASFYTDITERRQAANALAYRDRLLHTVTAATAVAVSALSLADGVATALAKIGETMEVDRILVIRNETDEARPLSVVFAWQSAAVKTPFSLDHPARQRIDKAALAAWRRPLQDGMPVIAHRATAEGAVLALMEHHATESLLFMPVFIAGALWGFLGIDACTARRNWAASEIETIGILADITGSLIVRERARIALETSEQRFRLLTSTARDAVTLTDEAAIILQWNGAAERIFGYTAAEVLGKNMVALLLRPGETAELVRTFKAITETAGITMEVTFRRKDGGEIAAEISVSAARVGGRLEFITIMRDITERKTAAQKLQFANTLLRTQMDASPDGILVVDANARIISCNRKFAAMWSIPDSLLNGVDDGPVLNAVTSAMKNPREFIARVRYLYEHMAEEANDELETSDGRSIDRHTQVIRTAAGTYLGRVWFFRDITEPKAAAQKLQFANVLLGRQMEASPAGIMVVDARRNMLSCNQRFAEIWRLPAEQIASGGDEARRAHILAQVAEPESYAARIDYLVEHPNEIGEDEVITRDGRTLERYTRSLVSPTGEPLGRVWFFSDVTARKRAAQNMQFTNILLNTQMEASPDGIMVLDANRRLVSSNRRLAEIWGLRPEHLNPGCDEARLAHIVAQGTQPEADMARVKYLLEHPDVIGEDEITTKDGRTIERYSRALNAPTGETLGRVWFFGDVTERKAAEQKLMLGNALLKTQLEASPDGIYVIGEDRQVLSYNQRFIDMWSLSEAKMLSGQRGWLRREVGKRLKAPEAFTDRVAHLNLHPEETADDILETLDGRIIEQHSVSLMAPDRNLGRAWFYRDITARRAAEALALRHARYDVLTGLANRAVFVEAVDQAITHARRDNAGFAVLFLDLDHFKDINDTLGHPAGDALLKAVAARLLGATRETDTVGRFGGDEFAVILAGIADAAGAGILAEKLIAAINMPLAIGLNTVHVRASIGIEIFSPAADDSDTLLSHADVALYRAKAEGRGTFRFFTAAMDRDVRSRVTLGAELRDALAAGQLFVLYQPQVLASTGAISGAEALIRWRHPERGLLAPEAFIEAAETTGAITELGHFVLWTVCRQAAAWAAAGHAPPRMSFNVSALQLKSARTLEADIMAALAQTGMPPAILELELTESALMGASQENRDVLRRLKEHGVKLAIDDFGTGYSSLEYLRRFPADHIKIARDFTRNVASEPSDGAIVRAIINLANELNITTIAEGIETRTQLELITSWGCAQMQGFYLARPLTAEKMTILLKSGASLFAKPAWPGFDLAGPPPGATHRPAKPALLSGH